MRGRLSPTSILLKCEAVCPPPQSSPIYGGGRRCHMRVLKLHVAASPSPALRGKAGMGDSAQMRSSVPHLGLLKCEVVCSPPQSSPIYGGGRRCPMLVMKLHVAASPSPAVRGKAGMGDSAQMRSFDSAQMRPFDSAQRTGDSAHNPRLVVPHSLHKTC